MNKKLPLFLLYKYNFCKFFFTALLVLATGFFSFEAKAQSTTEPKTPVTFQRCGTMEALELQAQTDPELKARMEQNEKDFREWLKNKNSGQLQRPVSPVPSSLPATVEIPVVVHIVLPNPWIISDDQVQYFINRLNLDFAGLNPDSTNGSNFYSVRGHSKLRFTLAKRDPAGNFTTGIIRKSGTTLIGQSNPQPIKNSATPTGGSTGWDITKYYNFYVGATDQTGNGELLGISPAIGPGTGPATTNADGVCVSYRAFGPACFSYDQYSLARTAVHEIGHNFGLYHIWGDNNPCVTGIDFSGLTSARSVCELPQSLLFDRDDTPNQSGSSSGQCPSGTSNSGCSGTAARMYQNYMDYTNDACYSMFTKGQVARMEYVLEFCRSGYLTTLGGHYPDNMQALDAMINSVVSPGGAEANPLCDEKGIMYSMPSCPGSFIPKLRITNAGTSTLTSVTVTTSVNGANAITETATVNIATGQSQVITLSPQMAVLGENALQFTLSAPNGGVDGNPSNDEMTVNFNTGDPIALPFMENFAAAVFPPDNGSVIINPDGPFNAANNTGLGWERSTAGKPGPGCMRIDCFDYEAVGARDIFSLPPLDLAPYDSVTISFYVAYRQRTAASNDSLTVVYSPDCYASWYRTGFAKGGAGLSTVASALSSQFTPGNSQWRKESVTIKDFCERGLKTIRIGFQSYNDNGNNIYVDSITVTGYSGVAANVVLDRIEEPLGALCNGQFTPKVSFRNDGLDTLKSLTVKYVIDNADTVTYQWAGSIGKCDYGTAALQPASAAFGYHVIDVLLSNPNGMPDMEPLNNKLTKGFTIITNENTQVTEGFDSTTFPPRNWGVYDVNGGTTWERSTAAAKTGPGALLINNPNDINGYDKLDYFVSPAIVNNPDFDSLHLDFDLAYKLGRNFPNTIFPLDTLEIFLSKDCGATFTSVWKKWGSALQTVPPDNVYTAPFVPAAATQWRTETIDLTSFKGTDNFQLYFAMKGNKQNNLWIDNINIRSEILPERLREQGYLIYPNPFSSTFLVHLYGAASVADLKAIQVFNTEGQRIWSSRYNGNASSLVTVDLKNVSRGMYIVKLLYSDRTVVERIVKH